MKHPEIGNAACVVMVPESVEPWLSMGVRGVMALGGEFGYLTAIEPAEKAQ